MARAARPFARAALDLVRLAALVRQRVNGDPFHRARSSGGALVPWGGVSPAADGDQPRRALETIATQRGERDVRKHGDPSPMIAARP